jgi:Fe-S-cluster containining protein
MYHAVGRPGGSPVGLRLDAHRHGGGADVARPARIRDNGRAMAAATHPRSPCDGCDARCCRSYTVHVTGSDAYRIASGTGLEMIQFLGYLAQAERTETGFLLQPGGPTYDLILETAPSGEPRRPCLFLRVDPETGEGRCGIYALRPAACRRFPAMRLHGPDGGIGVRDGIVCPDGAWDGYPIDRLSWRVALGHEEREHELYAVVVGEWNARVEAARGITPRTVEQYLDHLWDAYGWITRMRHALRPRDRAGPALLLRVGEALREFPGA